MEWYQQMHKKSIVTTNGGNVAGQFMIAFGHSTIMVVNIAGRNWL